MSMTKNSLFSPQDFINLKTRVKNEMLRRNGYGSLTAYGGTAYDFTNIPKKSEVLRIEHFTKIRDLMANINAALVSVGLRKVGDVVPPMNLLEINMTTFEAQSRSARTNNDCSANCTGMCVSQCTTSCSGCTGCGSACQTDCTGCSGCSGCGSACQTDCSGCTGTCTGGCSSCAVSCNNGGGTTQ